MDVGGGVVCRLWNDVIKVNKKISCAKIDRFRNRLNYCLNFDAINFTK